jgi:ABC-2 type transport system permease protein
VSSTPGGHRDDAGAGPVSSTPGARRDGARVGPVRSVPEGCRDDAGAGPRIRMRDLAGAELGKLRTLPATWLALGLAGVANTLIAVLSAGGAVRLGTAHGPVPIGQVGVVALAPAYVFAAIAVLGAGSEHLGGQLRVSLAAVPDRHRLFRAKLAASVAAGVLAAVPVLVPGHLVQRAGAAGLGALLLVYLLLSLLAYGIAVLTRSVVVPLVVLAGTPVLLTPVLRGMVPDVVRFLPHEAALGLLAFPGAELGRVEGLLVLAAWATVAVTCAWSAFAGRDS